MPYKTSFWLTLCDFIVSLLNTLDPLQSYQSFHKKADDFYNSHHKSLNPAKRECQNLNSDKPSTSQNSSNRNINVTPSPKRLKKANTSTITQHPINDQSIGVIPNLKRYLIGVIGNLFAHKWPSNAISNGVDLSWILRSETVQATNIQLIHKVNLWRQGYKALSTKVVSRTCPKSPSTAHQDYFANVLLPAAVIGISDCKIPLWLMSIERIVDLINGIDHAAVAEFLINLSSYVEFEMEAHLSCNSTILYVMTTHYNHCYRHQHIAKECHHSTNQNVFYGIDYESHVE